MGSAEPKITILEKTNSKLLLFSVLKQFLTNQTSSIVSFLIKTCVSETKSTSVIRYKYEIDSVGSTGPFELYLLDQTKQVSFC
jgi:hypothetical protein